MVGHMLLTMAIPLLLVAGAPVTLAARAIRKRDDGTRGGREWILWAVHSPVARVLTNPFVAAGLFVGSLWVFYFTDLFRWSLYDHLGHEWMIAHFLITGYLFVLTLIGIDPVPYRLPYAGRLVLLIGIMAIHAFFGIAIMMQSGLMVAEWFGVDGPHVGCRRRSRTSTSAAASPGRSARCPTLILAITVAIQWSRSDERAQKRARPSRRPHRRCRARGVQRAPAALAERDARVGRLTARARAIARRSAIAAAASGRGSGVVVPLRALEVAAHGAGQLVDGGADGRGESIGREALASCRSGAARRPPDPSSRRR